MRVKGAVKGREGKGKREQQNVTNDSNSFHKSVQMLPATRKGPVFISSATQTRTAEVRERRVSIGFAFFRNFVSLLLLSTKMSE